MADTFNARSTLDVGGNEYEIFRLDTLSSKHALSRLPYSLKVLLENLLRHEDGVDITLSYDHRIIDGREAVLFLVTIKEAIEDPARLLLGV